MVPPRLLARVALDYPEEAEAEQVHGDVVVRVGIDVHGHVVDAAFLDGPDVFREAALEAAYRLDFEPARKGDVAVPAALDVRFHFAPPAPPPPPSDEVAEEILVERPSEAAADTHAHETLETEDLVRATGLDLARTASQIAGVTAAGGTADNAKTIIRGQTERRLLILDDGVRFESQKWGPDHAPEIDPFAAGRLRVVKGAAGVRYGPDALGGVLIVEPPPMRQRAGLGGDARFSFASNGLAPGIGVRLDAVPDRVRDLSLRVEGTYRRGAALDAPTYLLGNTGQERWSVGGALRWQHDTTTLRLRVHHVAQRLGVFYGVNNTTPAEFEAQLTSERPPTADLWRRTYAIDRPSQQVAHTTAAAHLTARIGEVGNLETTYAFQLDRRLEFEQVREAVTGPQYDFTLRTHTLDVAFHHDPARVGAATLDGRVGVQGMFQENVYRGFRLLPNFRDGMVSVFAAERFGLSRGAVELGARYDHLSRGVFLSADDASALDDRERLPEACGPVEGSTRLRCAESYDTASVGVGGLWHLVPQTLDLKLDLSSASRFPDVDERYLGGRAPSFPVYAEGDPTLGVETTWSASPTAALRHRWIEAEASAFVTYTPRFVNFAPVLGASGAPAFEVTRRGTSPRYAYQGVRVLSYGTEATVDVAPAWYLGLTARGALVRLQDLDTQEGVVGTPPDRLHLRLTGRPPDVGPIRDPYLAVSTDLVARQTRVDEAADFAPAPPGYALLGLSAGMTLDLTRTELTLGVEATNLLNVRYRDYTSLLRYYADQPGRDVRVVAALSF